MRRAQEEGFARQKPAPVGTLANGIAHDFNNLLGGVLAQAEPALEELGSGSTPKEDLDAIRDVALRGSKIVRDLMIYAGKESEGARARGHFASRRAPAQQGASESVSPGAGTTPPTPIGSKTRAR